MTIAIRTVGIIGAGVMGTSIAAAHVRHGLPVLLCDTSEIALARAPTAIQAALEFGEPALARIPRHTGAIDNGVFGGADIPVCQDNLDHNGRQECLPHRGEKCGLESQAAAKLVDRLVRLTPDLAVLARADLVLESIVEVLSAKQQLYAQLQPHLGEQAILASNTSTIPIARLSERLAERGRFCGLHFFHPVGRRRLVEIARGPQTSNETIAAVVAHAEAIQRIPLVAADGPGFVVNRLLFPFLSAALQLLREGASVEAIERAALDFGMAMGPMRLMDEIGLDTLLHGGWVLAAAFPERTVASPLLVTMVKAGRLGQKSGRGFFRWPMPALPGAPGRPLKKGTGSDLPSENLAKSTGSEVPAPFLQRAAGTPDPDLDALIAPWAVPSGPHDAASILDRLLLPVVLEALQMLEEGRAAGTGHIDLALIHGLGFPPARGGLLAWAKTLCDAEILQKLRAFEIGEPRHLPPALLANLAQFGGTYGEIQIPSNG